MNKRPLSSAQLGMSLAAKLRELLGKVDWLKDWSMQNFPTSSERGFDFLVKLPLPKGGHAELWVQCKADPRPSQFPYSCVTNEGKRQTVLVFAAPLISPRMAEICQGEGWNWFDLAGNHRLDVPGLLRLQHTGNAAVHERPRPAANLSTAEAGRVIRALLAPENAGVAWTQRQLHDSAFASVSLGMVNKVVRHLRDEAFVEVSPKGGFRLSDPVGLLFAWREVYQLEGHERLNYFTLKNGWTLVEALAQVHARSHRHLVYAAFSAAAIQAPHVRQPKTWVYVSRNAFSLFEKIADAKPVDSGENIIALIPNDDGVFSFIDGGLVGDFQMACTNMVQTYVDLWNCGGRGQEAAEALLEQRIKPAWKTKGLVV